MKKAAIKKAVEAKVDQKIRQAIDDAAESEARSRVWDAMHPPMRFEERAAPADPAPAAPSSRSRVFSPNDPKLCGG